MFNGGKFEGRLLNHTENRSVLHTALRQPVDSSLILDGKNIIEDVKQCREKMADFLQKIHTKQILGFTNKPLRTLVSIGIGGSFLGPKVVTEALKPYAQEGYNCHYLANIDGTDLAEILQKIDPEAKQVQVWQASYLMNLIRQEDYAVDSKEVRQYFQYDKVRAGIFGLTQDLFGVQIRPWKTETWHEDVESYEILENGKLLGRFYMDNHPRDNKYKHAAHWTLRTGIKDKQIPMSGLAQNFPKGLMEHGQVETFLHEFGHLIHNMFSGNQKWYGISGMTMERDFVEAPSQMLEEWIWDYDTLKTFASKLQLSLKFLI